MNHLDRRDALKAAGTAGLLTLGAAALQADGPKDTPNPRGGEGPQPFGKDEMNQDRSRGKVRTALATIDSVVIYDFEAVVRFKNITFIGRPVTLRHVPRDLALAITGRIGSQGEIGFAWKEGKVENNELFAVLNSAFYFFA